MKGIHTSVSPRCKITTGAWRMRSLRCEVFFALKKSRCLWALILHALHGLDSCSFHLCCAVPRLLNLEAFTYELGSVWVPWGGGGGGGGRPLKLGQQGASEGAGWVGGIRQECEPRPRPCHGPIGGLTSRSRLKCNKIVQGKDFDAVNLSSLQRSTASVWTKDFRVWIARGLHAEERTQNLFNANADLTKV